MKILSGRSKLFKQHNKAVLILLGYLVSTDPQLKKVKSLNKILKYIKLEQ